MNFLSAQSFFAAICVLFSSIARVHFDWVSKTKRKVIAKPIKTKEKIARSMSESREKVNYQKREKTRATKSQLVLVWLIWSVEKMERIFSGPIIMRREAKLKQSWINFDT